MLSLKSISKEYKKDHIDSHNLRQLLNSISVELELPFVERRLRSKTLMNNCVEELKDTLSELCEKEKELLAAVGIANMLLDNNEKLASENLRLIESEENLAGEVNLLRQELSKCLETIRREEHKYKNTADALVITENELLKASCLLQIGKKDSSMKEVSVNEDAKELRDHLIKEVDRKNREGYLGSLSELQKNYGNAMSGKETVEAELRVFMEKYKKAHGKYKKANKKIKECEKINKVLLESKENTDKINERLIFENSKLKDKCESLQDNLNLYENSNLFQRSKKHVQNSSSLYDELRSIEYSNEDSVTGVEENEDDFLTYSKCSRLSSSGDFSISQCEGLGICGKARENSQDLSEEYFILTTQAVKMNSKHMESVCAVPHKILYEKAKKEQVPFYKWSGWIETQLNH